MKKLILCICLLLCACSVNVYGEENKVYFNDNTYEETLTLDNFNHQEGVYLHNGYDAYLDDYFDFAIYAEGDLNLVLSGDNDFSYEGIYVGGNLNVTGEGTLHVNSLEVVGETTTTCDIHVDSSAGLYINALSRPMSVVYGNDDLPARFYSGYYVDYVTCEEVEDITIKPSREYADFEKLYLGEKAYEYLPSEDSYYEVDNNNGFIPRLNIELDDIESVDYNPDTYIYTVKYNDEFNDEYVTHYIDFIFNTSELGKDVGYKILVAQNIFDEEDNPLEVDETYYELEGYVGQLDMFASEDEGVSNLGAAFLTFKAKENYKLSVELIGSNDNHRIININIDEENKEDNPTVKDNEYIVPNTSVH